MAKHTILPFLLGTLYSRVVVNEADHLLYGIKALFPETKRWVPEMLQKHFGGSLFMKQNKRRTSICYTIRSKKDLERLRRTLVRYHKVLPGVAPLLALFRKTGINPVEDMPQVRRRKRREQQSSHSLLSRRMVRRVKPPLQSLRRRRG